MTDTLTVYLSEDAWDGNAKAILTVNGVAVGGTIEVTALHSSEEAQAFSVNGDFGAKPVVALSFINDAYAGTSTQDRNLYLNGFSYDGVMDLGVKQELSYDRTLSYDLSSKSAPAARASDFWASLGVDVHLDYLDTSYGVGGGQLAPNTALVQASLDYLGINQLRVGLPNAETLPEMQTLAAHGVKFDVLMPSASTDALLSIQLASLDSLKGSISSVEGPNEVNLTSSFSWNGQSDYAAADAYQTALYNAAKADPALKTAAVYATTLGGVGEDAYQQLGNLSSVATAGNVHVYYLDGMPPASTIDYALGLAAVATPGLPVVITETNYTSAPAISGSVSEDVQARYDLDLLMDAAQSGVQATYLYELLDEHSDLGDTSNEDHFGLFHADGTPKSVATAIHNLSSILSDSGADARTFDAGALGYQIEGLPGSGNSYVLAKSNGVYDLIVWAEPEIWNVMIQSEITAIVRNVTLNLDVTAGKINIYDPLTGITPIATFLTTSSISVAITDHPIIIEINPATFPLTLALSSDTGTSASDKITSSAGLAGGSGANAVVTIRNGSFLLGTTTANSQGRWSFSPTNLVDGNYTLTASEVDTGGNSSSAVISFVLDTTAPATGIGLTTDTGISTSDKITSSAALSGSGDAGAVVTIYNGASTFGTTTADSQGHWSFTPSSLADGSYTLTAKETDAAGNTGLATLSFMLDRTASAVTVGLSNDTGSSNSDRITSFAGLTGSGDAQTTVTIRKGTTVLGTTTANSSGKWSYSPSGLTNGIITLTATETDTAGNVGTGTIAITLDTIAPKPTMNIITGISGGRVTLAGVSEANSSVTVVDRSNGISTVVGTAIAGISGAWSLTSNAAIDVTKIHTYTTSSTDVAGNIGTMPGNFSLASTGNDTLTSTPNVSDVFAIMSFKGSDVIKGFEASSVVGANHDYIDFSGRGITSFGQVKAIMSGTTSTMINIGLGKTITVANVAPSVFTAADFRYS